MKKRKLNSKNPKYRPEGTKVKDNKTYKLECTVGGAKVYSTYIND